jgi:hypothetical protein
MYCNINWGQEKGPRLEEKCFMIYANCSHLKKSFWVNLTLMTSEVFEGESSLFPPRLSGAEEDSLGSETALVPVPVGK